MEVRKHLKKGKRSMVFRQVESQNVEFKSSWRDEYLKVISAFANSDGGELRIGLMIMENQLELSMQKNCLRIFLIRLEIFWGIIPDVGIKAENRKRNYCNYYKAVFCSYFLSRKFLWKKWKH